MSRKSSPKERIGQHTAKPDASTQTQLQSSVERFWAGLGGIKPRIDPEAVHWNIAELSTWEQVFSVVSAAIQTKDIVPPVLHMVVDGGTAEILHIARVELSKATRNSGLQFDYRWITSLGLAPEEVTKAQEGWPNNRRFKIIPAESPAAHSGILDIVILFPDTNKHLWNDYIEGSWIVVVWENEEDEQEQLIEELQAVAKKYSGEGEYAPWLFKRQPNGLLKRIDSQKQDIIPLPERLQ